MDPEKNTPNEQQKEHVRTGARFAEDVQDGQDQLHPTLTSQTAQTGFTEDSEKGSSRYANSTAGLEMRAEARKAERRLLFKLGAFWLGRREMGIAADLSELTPSILDLQTS